MAKEIKEVKETVKIDPLVLDLGRDDLNAIVSKINEIISKIGE